MNTITTLIGATREKLNLLFSSLSLENLEEEFYDLVLYYRKDRKVWELRGVKRRGTKTLKTFGLSRNVETVQKLVKTFRAYKHLRGLEVLLRALGLDKESFNSLEELLQSKKAELERGLGIPEVSLVEYADVWIYKGRYVELRANGYQKSRVHLKLWRKETVSLRLLEEYCHTFRALKHLHHLKSLL